MVPNKHTFFIIIFFERQIWITDGPLEYHRATSGTTRSYPSTLGIMSIHQFRRKPNKYGKNHPCGNRTQDLLVSKLYPTLKMPLSYKANGPNLTSILHNNPYDDKPFETA
ncbi:hypothetical protein Hanom_Chr09g00817111 [Helianthus anomalus]